jgi:Fe-S-cluster-containing hydrogenase component 2
MADAHVKSNFSADEVAGMTDDELLHEFSRITGKTALSCKHCHKETCSLQLFVNAIRTRCLKPSSGGLHKDMQCPKTCDIQQAKNKVNAKINNYYYPRIRKADTEEKKAALRAEHKEALELL